MTYPSADVEITEGVVRSLLGEQFREGAAEDLQLVGEGFDNQVWRLGSRHALRLPRRTVAESLLLNETRWLPDLATRLSVPVPAATFVGRPSSAYPYAWAVMPWLSGIEADVANCSSSLTVAQEVARFLKSLHLPAPPSAPFNPHRSTGLEARANATRERLTSSRWPDAERAWTVFERGSRLNAPHDTWIHGDFHPGNLLMDDGHLSAVIDFGDLCAGDPATDLAGLWLGFEEEALLAALDTYEADAELVARAAGWAVALGALFLALGDHRATYPALGARALRLSVAVS